MDSTTAAAASPHNPTNAPELTDAQDTTSESGDSGEHNTAATASLHSPTDAPGLTDDQDTTSESEASEDHNGQWLQDDDQHYYELNFEACAVGKLFVSKALFADGRTGLTVGKVIAITDPIQRQFTAKMYQCTKPCYLESCIEGQWHPTKKIQSTYNYEVMLYFNNLTKAHRLPKKEQSALHERDDIDWSVVPYDV